MQKDTVNDFALRFTQALAESPHTAATLAQQIGSTSTSTSQYQRGIAIPNGKQLQRIAKELNVTMEWLITGEGPKRRLHPAAIDQVEKINGLYQSLADAEQLKDELGVTIKVEIALSRK